MLYKVFSTERAHNLVELVIELRSTLRAIKSPTTLNLTQFFYDTFLSRNRIVAYDNDFYCLVRFQATFLEISNKYPRKIRRKKPHTKIYKQTEKNYVEIRFSSAEQSSQKGFRTIQLSGSCDRAVAREWLQAVACAGCSVNST